MERSSGKGFVALVGAGPGDPGLLTVRGQQLLELADAVVYDYLANPLLLNHCPPGCERIYAGKKAAAHSMTQEQINQLLVDLGRAGKRVVRLKGGDPFVFGRGGEECEALARAGVRFEVVPGITAAIAAPAYAGIPVTHRDLNSSFTLITGHEKEEAYRDDGARSRPQAAGASDIDWPTIAKLPCVAFYMGVKALPRIAAQLIEHGLDPQTPAATIQWGTRPTQRTVVATIATIAEAVASAGIGAPAITIVGNVVALRSTLNWFESRPLFGRTIVVTRTRHQASDLSARLGELGANVIEAPTIELAPPVDPGRVTSALVGLRGGDYDWVVFTSANGVVETRRQLFANDLDARAFDRVDVAVLGAATAAAVTRELCLKPELVAQHATAEGVADELAACKAIAGRRFLILRADIGRPVLIDRLRGSGAARVDDVAVYETRPVGSLPENLIEAIDQKQVHWVTFTSSSTARNFVSLLGGGYQEKLAAVKIASIGPITSATLRELGLPPTVEASEANLDALVAAIQSAEL